MYYTLTYIDSHFQYSSLSSETAAMGQPSDQLAFTSILHDPHSVWGVDMSNPLALTHSCPLLPLASGKGWPLGWPVAFNSFLI